MLRSKEAKALGSREVSFIRRQTGSLKYSWLKGRRDGGTVAPPTTATRDGSLDGGLGRAGFRDL